jgi:nucleoside-diphosphate-sugar epimerase
MKARRLLFAGSSGCLGRPLASRLASEGRPVVGLDIVSASGAVPFAEIEGDVRNSHLLHRLVSHHAFGTVVHCGGNSGGMVAADDPYRNGEVNVSGTAHLPEVARVHQVACCVYCSS